MYRTPILKGDALHYASIVIPTWNVITAMEMKEQYQPNSFVPCYHNRFEPSVVELTKESLLSTEKIYIWAGVGMMIAATITHCMVSMLGGNECGIKFVSQDDAISRPLSFCKKRRMLQKKNIQHQKKCQHKKYVQE